MRVCFVSVEIFAWGKYGGFGRATRIIGRELAKRGVSVYAVVPRRQGQGPVEDLDGIRVLSFEPWDWLSAFRLLRQADADIYHSQEPSFGSYLAMQARPGRVHTVTFNDPHTIRDWLTEMMMPSLNPVQVLFNWFYQDNLLVQNAVRRMDRCYSFAEFIVEKAQRKYRLNYAPDFLPTPVVVPETVQKAEEPTVCFIARWDKRKRPELFFELARSFPEVRFLAAGKSRNPARDKMFAEQYGHLANLEMLGFIDQFRGDQHTRLLEKSWIFVNTAVREGLPNAFLEAAAHRCAILSAVDPDRFSSRFGYHAADDDFASGLRWLLENERWKVCGAAGYEFVNQVFAVDHAIDCHLEVYHQLLASKGMRTRPG